MLSQVEAKPTDSLFWKGLMRVKYEFFKHGLFKVGNGQLIRFWEDTWLGDTPLAHQYPSLYNIVRHKHVRVANVLAQAPLNIAFRRHLSGNKWNDWLHLCQRLMAVNLTPEPDSFVWKLTNTDFFTVKSLYLDLMNDSTRYLHKYLWKLKVPLKVKIFM